MRMPAPAATLRHHPVALCGMVPAGSAFPAIATPAEAAEAPLSPVFRLESAEQLAQLAEWRRGASQWGELWLVTAPDAELLRAVIESRLPVAGVVFTHELEEGRSLPKEVVERIGERSLLKAAVDHALARVRKDGWERPGDRRVLQVLAAAVRGATVRRACRDAGVTPAALRATLARRGLPAPKRLFCELRSAAIRYLLARRIPPPVIARISGSPSVRAMRVFLTRQRRSRAPERMLSREPQEVS